ncbi:hypothetical protein FB451DRAFT_1223853 [Mycena latifolia]|nr:hypothetical protein FB451DRAFT_1223853 [Mycena latifolia]
MRRRGQVSLCLIFRRVAGFRLTARHLQVFSYPRLSERIAVQNRRGFVPSATELARCQPQKPRSCSSLLSPSNPRWFGAAKSADGTHLLPQTGSLRCRTR